jgi:hypothetical protein
MGGDGSEITEDQGRTGTELALAIGPVTRSSDDLPWRGLLSTFPRGIPLHPTDEPVVPPTSHVT